MRFDVYEYTNHGGRDYNEDAVGHKVIGDNGVFLVADGLGGHNFGEVASACVRDTLVNGFGGDFGGNPAGWLEAVVNKANENILAIQKEKNDVLKSTVVALCIENGRAVWGNVGDSRLYYIHNGDIAAYTNDHSVAYKKFKAGEITRDQLRSDEDQSALLRSLGSDDRHEVELYDNGITVVPGDAFMLCSDGVWEFVKDYEVLIDLLKAHNAKEWAELLLLRMMERIQGGNDNLTIQTIMIN